uniref:Uncharacterized protein n=1 Tax=Solanum lycopersicum TaxID=4081 RepID=A0A3Q7GHE9_SOLLC
MESEMFSRVVYGGNNCYTKRIQYHIFISSKMGTFHFPGQRLIQNGALGGELSINKLLALFPKLIIL